MASPCPAHRKPGEHCALPAGHYAETGARHDWQPLPPCPECAAAQEQIAQLTAALERMYDAFKNAAEDSVATRHAFESVAADATLAAWVYGP